MRGCAIRLSIFLHHLAGTIHAAVVSERPSLPCLHTLRADMLMLMLPPLALVQNELFALRQIAERCISLVRTSRSKWI